MITQNKFQRVVCLLFVLLPMSAFAHAQGICIPEKITVAEVKGQVFFEHDGKRRVQEGVLVQIVSQRANRPLIETTTDSDGRFSIKWAKVGRYWLRTKHPQIIGIDAELVTGLKKRRGSKLDSQIVFFLGADPSRPCGGGRVELATTDPSLSPQKK